MYREHLVFLNLAREVWTICALHFPSKWQQRRQKRSRQWRRRVERRRRCRIHQAEEKNASKELNGAPEKVEESLSELVGVPKCWTQRKEACVDPIAVSGSDSGTTGKDHLLLILRAVINDTCVSALVDSGATRSFMSEQLQTRATTVIYWCIFLPIIGKWRDHHLNRNCTRRVGMYRVNNQ